MTHFLLKGKDFMEHVRYKKKPIVVDAFQYNGDLIGSSGKYYVPDWAVEAFSNEDMFYSKTVDSPSELFIKTLEGNMRCNVGDYVIKGVNGEFYPCKPDIFEQTYDEVKEYNYE